jgi:hypothetical protein
MSDTVAAGSAVVIAIALSVAVVEFGAGGHADQVNADGSCEQVLLGNGVEGVCWPVWQPGRGRAAGPISC